MGDRARLPGAIGASHLRVYDTTAPDGLAGGTPHLHTVCTEAYYVVAGQGSVQTLTAGRGFAETELERGAMVWFTPGTIHRLVNGGGLEILVLMQNAGLPEAGDLVVTLPAEVLADPARYEAQAVLPEHERTTAGPGLAARARRNAAVEEFGRLRAALDAGDGGPLDEHLAAAARLVAPQVVAWRALWEHAALAEAAKTGTWLDALGGSDGRHLRDATLEQVAPPAGERRMGCCGTLGTLVAADG